jgi:signal transduction histidine kinase/DNA-binding response OmpR family regulator
MSQHHRTANTAVIVATSIAIVSSLLMGTFFHNQSEYNRNIETVYGNLSSYAKIVAAHTANSLNIADHLLLFLKYSYEKYGNVDDVLKFMNKDVLSKQHFNQIGIVDEHGTYLTSNLEHHEKVDLSDREHFLVHKNRHDDTLFISKPVVGRATGKLSIQLSRRLDKPDGSFGGVVVISVNPYLFSNLYEKIQLGEQGIVNIVGLDGIVRARRNMDNYSAGQDISTARLFTYLKEHDGFSYRTTSLIDGTDRFFAYRRLEGYPLVVLVGQSSAEALAEYRWNSRMHYVFAGAVSLLTVVSTLLFLHLLRKQRLMLDRVVVSQKLAEEANRFKTDFLAKVTHEIRTPLHAVKGMTDYLLHTPLADDQRDCLDTVKVSADHLLGMVNDLLDIARIEAGQLRVDAVPFDLRELLASVGRIMEPLARDKAIGFHLGWRDGAAGAVVLGDPGRLRQVILNLAGNAIKFTRAGEVRLVARLEPAAAPDRVRLEVRVEDTGPGIPACALETIFQPFSQADGTIAGRYGGTGLGLAICRQLLGLMGGALAVESTVGVGSVFRITLDLPRGDPAAMASLPRQDLALPPLAILVVDDNATNIKVAVRLLGRLGQRPDCAGSGPEALAALGRDRYDVVLLDIEMPGMDGFELIRRIRAGEAGPGNRGVSVIAMTAHSMRTFQRECLAAGMQGFLAKPIEVERLHAVLSGIAGRKSRPGRATAQEGAGPTPAEAIVDVHAALERLAGDRQLYRAVCGDFVERYDPDAMELLRADTADLEALVLFAHTLKGLARTLGMAAVASLAERLELAARSGDRAAALAVSPDLEAALRRALAAIGHILADFGPAEAGRQTASMPDGSG